MLGLKVSESFEQLMLPHYDTLVKSAMKLCGDRQTAEDLVQDTYAKAHIKFESYDPDRGKPITWLHTILRRRFFDTVKRRTPTENVPLKGLPEIHRRALPLWSSISHPAGPEMECDKKLVAEAIANIINTALSSVSDRDRSIFQFWLDGKSFQEAGEAHGLHRARAQQICRKIIDSIRPFVIRSLKVEA